MRGYRRDIDGLRAVAVLPVVLLHAHVSGVSGGYVGLDVYFVISGTLITAIIIVRPSWKCVEAIFRKVSASGYTANAKLALSHLHLFALQRADFEERTYEEGEALYYDDDHLSSAGAALLRHEFDRVMKAGQVAAQVVEGDGTL